MKQTKIRPQKCNEPLPISRQVEVIFDVFNIVKGPDEIPDVYHFILHKVAPQAKHFITEKVPYDAVTR